jgi:integrase
LLPTLDETPLQDVKTAQITAITDRLAATPAEQNHAHRIHSAFFSWAHRRRMIPTNPMRDLPLPSRPRTRTRVLADAELRDVYRAAQDIGCPFGFIVLILIHTGMRRSEAAALKWSYITPDTISLPPEITKNNTALTIPNLIGENFALVPRTNDLLFPSSVGRLFNSWGKAKEHLDRRSGVTSWCLHDLRRTFSTIHARLGTPPHVTEAILNHKTGVRSPLQRIYDQHDYLPQMRTALQNYERFLADLCASPRT